MPNAILLKRSSTPNTIPSANDLLLGEIAINTYDGKAYFKKDDGSESVLQIATTSNEFDTLATVTSRGSTTSSALSITNNTSSTTTTSGALIITGGIGIGENITLGGTLNISGTGNKIYGDFNNSTVSNRVLFQTSGTNAQTSVGIIPNGTGTQSSHNIYNSSDANNASYTSIICSATESSIRSLFGGTGSYLPLTIHTGGNERLRINSDGIATFNNTVIFGSSLQHTVNNLGSVSGTIDIDMNLGTLVVASLTNDTTFTVSNSAISGKVSSFTLELENGGSFITTFMSNTFWENGITPTLSTSGIDILTFYTRDGGVSWRGVLVSSNNS